MCKQNYSVDTLSMEIYIYDSKHIAVLLKRDLKYDLKG